MNLVDNMLEYHTYEHGIKVTHYVDIRNIPNYDLVGKKYRNPMGGGIMVVVGVDVLTNGKSVNVGNLNDPSYFWTEFSESIRDLVDINSMVEGR